MPKKSFRFSNSTILIKKSKFSSIPRHKVINKRPKLFLIDEKNENNWKYLKSELGYKSDSSFLEYLLNLARRDLNSFRQKKRQIQTENEESVKNVDFNAINNGKQGHPMGLYKTVSCNFTSSMENEKKEVCLPITEREIRDIDYRTGSDQKVPSFPEKQCGNKKSHSTVSEGLNQVSCITDTKIQPLKNDQNENSKTESAKEASYRCISLTEDDITRNMNNSPTFKEVNSSDKNFINLLKNYNSVVKLSSPKSNDKAIGKLPKNGNFQSGEPNKNILRKKETSEKSRKKSKHESILCKFERSPTNVVPARDNFDSTKQANHSTDSSRDVPFCAACKNKHVVGECMLNNNVSSHSETMNGKKYSKTDAGVGNDNSLNHGDGLVSFKNIYDFDDNEREINIEVNSRWCHKLLKAEDNPIINSVPIVGEEMSNKRKTSVPPLKDLENDTDSSNSDLKLKIDESFRDNRSFAESSLPSNLILKVSDDEHGQSVFTKLSIAKSTHFGPLLGQKVKEMDIPDDFNMKFIWEVNSVNGIFFLSTKDPDTSNWIRFLRPANSRESANLLSSIRDNCLYFISTRDISAGEELIYWMDDIHSAWSKKKLEKKNCGGCNIQFSHPLYYRKHCMIFHDPTCSLTIRKYHCKICGLAVLGKEKIMKHAAEMHQGKGAYQCQYCHKFFLRLNYLEMHRTYGCSKNPQRSRPLCDLCGRKFCQPQKLKVHIKRMHSDMAQVLKDFQCKSCLKILGSRAALQRHMKEVHNKDIVGASTCDRCGKMFQNKSNLKIHMLTHSGVKPFKCQQTDCTAAFTTKQCLQFHYKKVHGFTDDVIPKIERSIAYTFDAYSGGIVSEPGRVHSPRIEDHAIPLAEQRECGLDLSSVAPLANDSAVLAKDTIQLDNSSESGINLGDEENKISQRVENCYIEKDVFERTPEPISVKLEEDFSNRKFNQIDQVSNLESNQVNKILVSKGSKKWLGLDVANEKCEERLKSIFRRENSNATLLVEAAISAAEKDIIDQQSGKSNTENVGSNPPEIFSVNQFVASSPNVIYDSSDKKMDDYGRISIDSQKSDSYQDSVHMKRNIPVNEKTNFSDFIRYNTLLRINTSPVNELPKDYNISSIIRDQESESFTDIEIQDYRNRDFLDTYKDGEGFHEPYRTHELYRSEKLDLYRASDSDFRMTAIDKCEYRDFDLSSETYRNLTSNLEKYRNADIYRIRSEGYELSYRDLSDERDGEAQNLCLKEKSFQYETLEELARIGRDNPGFECLLVSDAGSVVGNQNFAPGAPRSFHGMLSPRSYHPTYESESVDLSVPRPPYSSSPVYTLDLTSTRVELPTRHIDYRSHLGLSPHRFPNSRLPGLSSGASQNSPTGYSIYSSPYVTPSTRHSPTTQFQPYSSLYY